MRKRKPLGGGTPGSYAVILVFAASCRPHVELAPPSLQQEPTKSYEALHIDSMETRSPSKDLQAPARRSRAPSDARPPLPRSVTLGDGTQVYHAEDLEPLVGDVSSTHRAIELSKKRRKTARVFEAVGGILMGSGVAYVGGTAVGVATSDGDDGGIRLAISMAVGSGLVLVGGALVGAGGGYRSAARRSDLSAYQTYNDDLKAALGVCEREDVLVPCADEGDE